MPQRWIYFFGNHHADGSSDIKHLIGGKGASLADMTRAVTLALEHWGLEPDLVNPLRLRGCRP